MSAGAKTIDADALAAEAVTRMENDSISALIVVDEAATGHRCRTFIGAVEGGYRMTDFANIRYWSWMSMAS